MTLAKVLNFPGPWLPAFCKDSSKGCSYFLLIFLICLAEAQSETERCESQGPREWNGSDRENSNSPIGSKFFCALLSSSVK